MSDEQTPHCTDIKEPGQPAGRHCGLRRVFLEALGLTAVLACAAGLRLWNIDQNGYGNSYYAAAVRSMLGSATNFIFGSFDPAGFITVDKPPAAMWIQAGSAAVFGYSGRSLLVPQALMGVASVLLTYWLVRRVAGPWAGLLAGLIVAITPISVAVDRDNLPDSALVFVLLLSLWAMSRAVETGRWAPLLAAVALVGLAFNVKMLAAFVVLPTFYLAYLYGAPVGWRARLGKLTVATVVLAAVSLSWSLAVELTPREHRPYIGGSQTNSALELAMGYNGLGRVFGGWRNRGPRGGAVRTATAKDGQPDSPTPTNAPAPRPVDETKKDGVRPNDDNELFAGVPPFPPPGGPPGGPRPGGPPGGPGGFGGFGGRPGPLRFAGASMAGQITWLLPMAIMGILAAGRFRWGNPPDPAAVAVFLWAGWLVTHLVVFSGAQGIFHEYYTTVMAPAVAALAAIGFARLWTLWFHVGWRGLFFPVALLLTAAWQAYIIAANYPDARRWLLATVSAGVGATTFAFLALRIFARYRGVLFYAKLAAALSLVVLLVGPAGWSLATVMRPGNPVMPSAPEPVLFAKESDRNRPFGPPFGMGPRANPKLIEFLRANRRDERFLVVATSVMPVAPIIIATGEPALALGGFSGGDPVLTKDDFAQMVEEGQIRFVLVGGFPGGPPPGGPPGGNVIGAAPLPFGFPGGPGGPPGPGGPVGFGGPPGAQANAALMTWVRQHGKEVNARLWQASEPTEALPPDGPGNRRGRGRFGRMEQLYDCRPELGYLEPGSPAGE